MGLGSARWWPRIPRGRSCGSCVGERVGSSGGAVVHLLHCPQLCTGMPAHLVARSEDVGLVLLAPAHDDALGHSPLEGASLSCLFGGETGCDFGVGRCGVSVRQRNTDRDCVVSPNNADRSLNFGRIASDFYFAGWGIIAGTVAKWPGSRRVRSVRCCPRRRCKNSARRSRCFA